MKLIIKNADNTFSEVNHVVGQPITGAVIMSVFFSFRDCGDPENLWLHLTKDILPRMAVPTDRDFLTEKDFPKEDQ